MNISPPIQEDVEVGFHGPDSAFGLEPNVLFEINEASLTRDMPQNYGQFVLVKKKLTPRPAVPAPNDAL
jgi:hypothetical protein